MAEKKNTTDAAEAPKGKKPSAPEEHRYNQDGENDSDKGGKVGDLPGTGNKVFDL